MGSEGDAETATRSDERDAALWRLAERLYETMEKLDPSGTNWENLTYNDRFYFYFSVDSMLSEVGDVLRVLNIDLTNHNMIYGGSR
jgi:hypothetical protein